jgi:hypothetical protein
MQLVQMSSFLAMATLITLVESSRMLERIAFCTGGKLHQERHCYTLYIKNPFSSNISYTLV